MEQSPFFKDYEAFVNFRSDRYGKATLFENEHVLVGLNCLEPGQVFEKHAHTVQCRFYIVLNGLGLTQVGDEEETVHPGTVVWVPAGCRHRIMNNGSERLVLMVGITPPGAD